MVNIFTSCVEAVYKWSSKKFSRDSRERVNANFQLLILELQSYIQSKFTPNTSTNMNRYSRRSIAYHQNLQKKHYKKQQDEIIDVLAGWPK